MPEMDGVEATRLLFAPDRAAPPRSRPVRVVVLTTFNLDDRAATAIRYGASGFLLKDTTPADAARRDPHRARRQRRARSRRTSPRCWTDSSRARRPLPAAYSDADREGAGGLRRGRARAVQHRDRREVFASESTVKTHVGAILRKLALRDRVQIVVFAHEHGLAGGLP